MVKVKQSAVPLPDLVRVLEEAFDASRADADRPEVEGHAARRLRNDIIRRLAETYGDDWVRAWNHRCRATACTATSSGGSATAGPAATG